MGKFSFFISPSEIHRLNNKSFPKKISITLNASIFLFSFTQLLLFSPKLAQKNFETGENISLDFPDKYESEHLLSCFSQLYSLLFNETVIKITHQNVHFFRIFAEKLGHIPLKKTCTRVSVNRFQVFSLSFEVLTFVPEKILQSLSYFNVDTDYESFKVNPQLMSCLSDTFYDAYTRDTSISNFEFDVFSDEIPFFAQILSVLSGIELVYQTEDIQIFLRLSTVLGSSSLKNSVCHHLPKSHSLSEHLQRIAYYSSSYGYVFESNIAFLARYFGKIPFSYLLKIPLEALELIMLSDSLQIPSETYLFETIIQLISNDLVYQSLLKCVRFELVKSSVLREFFESFGLVQLTTDIWEHLKGRLFSHVLVDEFDKERYTTPNDDISKPQIQSIIDKANALSDEHLHPFDKIMKLLSSFKSPKVEMLVMKKSDSFNGIIAKLRDLHQSKIHEYVTVSCSSTNSGNPNLLLEWNGVYWYSHNLPNSSFTVSLKNYSITLCGYAIHSHSGTADFLINWKIEISDDGESWITVDQQENHRSIAFANCKEYFTVSTDLPATYIRLIQIGPGSSGTDHLIVGAIEFYGALSSLNS